AALRVRGFQLFIGGFSVSVIAMQMEVFSARLAVYRLTDSEVSLAGIGLASAIPMLLMTLPAGQLADLLSRRRIMYLTMLASAACATCLAFVAASRSDWAHSTTAIYALVAIGSVAATLGRPARAALMPQLVAPAVFANATAWNATIFET